MIAQSPLPRTAVPVAQVNKNQERRARGPVTDPQRTEAQPISVHIGKLGEGEGGWEAAQRMEGGRICINIIHLVLQKPKCCCVRWREALAVASCQCYLLAQLCVRAAMRGRIRGTPLLAPATSSICSANLNWKIYIYKKKKD